MTTRGSVRLTLVVALVLLVGACGGSTWEATPSGSPSARGLAAYSCVEGDGLFVWSGALPSGGPLLRLVSGGRLLTGDGWAKVGSPPLEPRVRAGAVAVDDWIVMFGGSNEVSASSNPDDFFHYADGAVYSLVTGDWEELPVAPLAGRIYPRLVPYRSMVFVYGGDLTPPHGSATDAAFLELPERSWLPAAAPEMGSRVVVAGGDLLSFGRSGVQTYNQAGDRWVPIASAPDGFTEPDAVVATTTGEVIVIQTPDVWRYNRDTTSFDVLAEIPADDVTGAGANEAGVVVWDESDGKLAVLADDGSGWTEIDGPRFFEKREGTTFCIGPTRVTIWGGWLDRETVLIATDTGASISVDDLATKG